MSEKDDGGPAFPGAESEYIDHPVHGRVLRAAVGLEAHPGMSLRDWFAGQALAGLCVHPGVGWADAAVMAYRAADALLDNRSQSPLSSSMEPLMSNAPDTRETVLKPCPFCGGKDIRHTQVDGARRCACMSCRSYGPPVFGVHGENAQDTNRKRAGKAYALWNIRAPSVGVELVENSDLSYDASGENVCAGKTAPVGGGEYVLVPRATVDFLTGAAADENGVWFGDKPKDAAGNFWWRRKLHGLAAAPLALERGEDAERTALIEWSEMMRDHSPLTDCKPWFARITAYLTNSPAPLPDDAPLSQEEINLIDKAWETHKAALPVAKIINDNQPGRTAIIEILRDPPTLGVGTQLFAAPVSAVSPSPAHTGEPASIDVLAKLVHMGRFPEDRAPTPFAEEDKSGREYCYRIARLVQPFTTSAPAHTGEELVRAHAGIIGKMADIKRVIDFYVSDVMPDDIHFPDLGSRLDSEGPSAQTLSMKDIGELISLCAALTIASQGKDGWFRIDDTENPAPKDGTHILGYGKLPGYEVEVFGQRETYWRLPPEGSPAAEAIKRGDPKAWQGGWDWYESVHNWSHEWKPTHWRHLPLSPKED